RMKDVIGAPIRKLPGVVPEPLLGERERRRAASFAPRNGGEGLLLGAAGRRGGKTLREQRPLRGREAIAAGGEIGGHGRKESLSDRSARAIITSTPSVQAAVPSGVKVAKSAKPEAS